MRINFIAPFYELANPSLMNNNIIKMDGTTIHVGLMIYMEYEMIMRHFRFR